MENKGLLALFSVRQIRWIAYNFKSEIVSEWVEFNAPLDTIQVISETKKNNGNRKYKHN